MRRLGPLALLLLAACGPGSDVPVRLRVLRGASFSQVTDSLVARGVIENRLGFRLMGRLTHTDRQLKPGLYEFPAHIASSDVLSMLRDGRTIELRFTLPEGLTIWETADLAAAKLGMPADSVVAAARDTTLLHSLGLPGPSFEGYLRPDTYQVPGDASARDLVLLLGRAFLQGWDSTWDDRLTALGIDMQQAVAMASIVEGEARADDERETIAGVYWNRRRAGMALQADPTVQYAIGLATGERKKRLFEKDYGIQSPYNTYEHPGLPPGPVNSPSRRSLEAALHPATVPFYYFVAGPDGRHRFSRTYAEHLRNVAAMRKKWRAVEQAEKEK